MTTRHAIGCLWATWALAACGGGTAALDGGADAVENDAAEVAPDLGPPKTTIRVHYPAGEHTMSLRGGGAPLDWSQGVAMTPAPGSMWIWTSDALAGEVEFKPLLDDTTWARGANYHVQPGRTIDVYPHFLRTQGEIMRLFTSFPATPIEGGVAQRDVWVYLPAVYLENERAQLPVLYMHDGQNLFAAVSGAFGCTWEVDTTLDAAGEHGWCADGRECTGDGDCGTDERCRGLPDVIVIAPETTNERLFEYTPTVDASLPQCATDRGCGGGELYLTMLIDQLKPAVDDLLRTRPERRSTGLMGSSLGGLISAWGGIHHPEVFGLVGALSPSTWWDSRMILDEVAGMAAAPLRALRVYVDSGDSGPEGADDGKADTDLLAAAYLSVGYAEGVDFHHIVQQGGEHSECWWRLRFPWALAFLFAAPTVSP